MGSTNGQEMLGVRAHTDVNAVWSIEEDPSLGHPSLLCIPGSSFLQAPMRRRTDKENNALHELGLHHLPNYITLCKMEFNEMSMWIFERPTITIPGRQGTAATVITIPSLVDCAAHLPSFVALLCKYLAILSCILGLGHLFTRVGRCAFHVVAWKYLRFFLLCFGFWTDDVVNLYHVHDKLIYSSVVWMHPFFRSTRSTESKAYEGKNTQAEQAVHATNTSMKLGSADSGEEGWGNNSTLLSSLASLSRRLPTNLSFSALKVDFNRWWDKTVYHTEETPVFESLKEVTLKVLYANDHSAGIRSIVGTRSVLLQLIPGLAIISIFCELTASVPLFVFSRSRELSLPEIICKDPFQNCSRDRGRVHGHCEQDPHDRAARRRLRRARGRATASFRAGEGENANRE